MKRILGGKAFTATIAAFVILSLVFVVVQCVPFIAEDFTNNMMSVMLCGEYSVDGGEWQSIDPEQSITDHFHKITVRGKLDETAVAFEILAVSSKNTFTKSLSKESWTKPRRLLKYWRFPLTTCGTH